MKKKDAWRDNEWCSSELTAGQRDDDWFVGWLMDTHSLTHSLKAVGGPLTD